MTRSLVLVALLAGTLGCRHASPLPVVVYAGSTADTPCVDRLVTLARSAGYFDASVDRSTGFFRVQLTALRNGKPIRTGTRGMIYSFYLHAQCSQDGLSATVYGADSRGGFSDERPPPGWLRNELDYFASRLTDF